MRHSTRRWPVEGGLGQATSPAQHAARLRLLDRAGALGLLHRVARITGNPDEQWAALQRLVGGG